MKTITILKGGAGVGKGTRVCHLIEYLKSQGYEFQTAKLDGKQVGFYSPQEKLFILGKIVTSPKTHLKSLSGIDAIVDKFDDVQDIIQRVEFPVEHFILEGGPVTSSFRFRPKFLKENLGAGSVFAVYYDYEGDEQLFRDRLAQRSGDKATCIPQTLYKAMKGYQGDHANSWKESGEDESCHITMNSAIDEPHMFVEYYLNNVLCLEADPVKIEAWCKQNSFKREVGKPDPLSTTNDLW